MSARDSLCEFLDRLALRWLAKRGFVVIQPKHVEESEDELGLRY